MAVNILLSATIKVVKMEHKKRKITMGFALLVCAMVALVGVGYALAYQGSATTPIDDTQGELITVGFNSAPTGIFSESAPATSTFTVNTLNNGTNVTVNTLKENGSAKSEYNEGHFTYSENAFTWVTGVPVANGYASAVAGAVSLSIKQSADASTDTDYFRMTVTGLNAEQKHEFGMSLIYTYKIGDGDETVMSGTTVPGLVLTPNTAVNVVITAYVVYNTLVAVEHIGDITPLTLADGSSVTFTVEAQDSAFA